MVEPDLLEDAGVSEREAEVLAALGERLTNAEIGARLYISVRTVESHVSSLLRKLAVSDRRALAELATTATAASASPPSRGEGSKATAPGAIRCASPTVLPRPLTTFVGRRVERAALADAVGQHRLVTAVGPGGVGKTRLVLAVAAEVTERFADGAWYVDLVPVTDDALVAPAVSAALGLGEQSRRTAEDTVIAGLADSEALLVIDNCEHLVDAVAVLVERLLTSCPRLTVLAASRARLAVPFEWVFSVPGLSLDRSNFLGAAGGPPDELGPAEASDAVTLFVERAAAAGSPRPGPEELRRVAAICRRLDGMALAIELAAARLPALGLDGLEAGLADRLSLLAGGSRLDDRHRSLHATLDWSYALADPADQAALRRLSVFAAPFSADAAAALAGYPPIDGAAEIPGVLARLVDQSLLVPVPGPGGTRYRMLETIRQYGSERLIAAGETAEVRRLHLQWCQAGADALHGAPTGDLGALAGWRAAFDAVADDLRAAAHWASETPEQRAEAHDLVLVLADLCFDRGLASQAQARYEQVAALSDDDRAAADALRYAAGAAQGRHVGNDALRLHKAAAAAAMRGGDRANAVASLAQAATLINRGPGLFGDLPAAQEVDALAAEARDLAGAEPAPSAEAALLIAEAFKANEYEHEATELGARAVALSQEVGAPLLESAALDVLTAAHLAHGQIGDAVTSTSRRLELLAPLAVDALVAPELVDAYQMAAETRAGAGALDGARTTALGLLDLPFYREEGHLATARYLVVAGLRGDWDEVLALSGRFRESWERAGSPRVGNLGMSACAVAMVHGLRGDDQARAEWADIQTELRATVDKDPRSHCSYILVFDALVLLHRGDVDGAVERLTFAPEDLRRWFTGMWRQWYAAVWAEAAAVSGHPEAADRVARARVIAAGNPVAEPMVERAEGLRTGDRRGFVALAAALGQAGCRYQEARTLVLAHGDAATEGRAALAAMGAMPMTAP